MRIRTIKPEFWQDEEIAELSPEAALLALGLLNFADDEGYFRFIPKLIESTVFPLRELSVSIHALLTELSNMGYLREYEGSNGKRFGHVVNFQRHQKVNRPSPSKFAPFIKACESSVSPHELITEVSLAEQGTGNREMEQGKGEGSDGKDGAAAPLAMIEKIVKSYPKQSHFRESREAVEAAIERNAQRQGKSAVVSAEEILAGTEAIAAKLREWSISERNQFAPTPPNFFNGDRWADDPVAFETRQGNKSADAGNDEQPMNLGGRAARKVTDLRNQPES